VSLYLVPTFVIRPTSYVMSKVLYTLSVGREPCGDSWHQQDERS
jgi:hypothetical protein